jgi:methylamine dehydrogenase accessory protein MauD
MTGLWLASYLVLWGIVVVMFLFLIGILRHLGLVYRQLELRPPQPQGGSSLPTLEQDGPTIGSLIADLEAGTINGFGILTPAKLSDGGNALLVFMSPMCEACQDIVELLNALVADTAGAVRPVVIMRADEQACRAFLSVFPLRMPVVCDSDRTITMGLDIHRTPFGLLYDEHSTLIRKGLVEGHEDLLALLGDGSVSDTAQSHVFPRVVSSLNARMT